MEEKGKIFRVSTLAYEEQSKVIEIIGTIKEEDLEVFFDKLKDVDFRENLETESAVLESLTGNILALSLLFSINNDSRPEEDKELLNKEIISAFKRISESRIIDLSEIKGLLSGKRKINATKLAHFCKEFMSLYSYEKKSEYPVMQFNEIYRAVMTLGTDSEKHDFNLLSQSVEVNNAVLSKIKTQGLVIDYTEDAKVKKKEQ